jgi:hypothetical protein
MSLKSSLLKFAIDLTPNFLIVWVANIVLKGIAHLSDFMLDLDARTAYVCLTLYGEEEPIEVWFDDFAIFSEGDVHRLIIKEARSNRPWLSNLLARVAGRSWKIPAIPQFKEQIDLVSE